MDRPLVALTDAVADLLAAPAGFAHRVATMGCQPAATAANKKDATRVVASTLLEA